MPPVVGRMARASRLVQTAGAVARLTGGRPARAQWTGVRKKGKRGPALSRAGIRALFRAAHASRLARRSSELRLRRTKPQRLYSQFHLQLYSYGGFTHVYDLTPSTSFSFFGTSTSVYWKL